MSNLSKNVKILTVALVLLAAVFMKVMNSQSGTTLQGRLEAPGTNQRQESVVSTIRDCLVTPRQVSLKAEGLTTIAFTLDKRASVEVELKQKDSTLHRLPVQNSLEEGDNRLQWTGKVIKDLVGGKAGEYTIKLTAKESTWSAVCEAPLTVTN